MKRSTPFASAIVAIDALLDSNVVIAMLVEAHEHHAPSSNLFADDGRWQFAVAAHSFAEAYSTLTRRTERAPFRFTPEEARAALDSIRAITILVGLTPARTYAAIRDYAQGGGIGARLYDRLIGEAAVANGIGRIVTWNVGHMQRLFPNIDVMTPERFARVRD